MRTVVFVLFKEAHFYADVLPVTLVAHRVGGWVTTKEAARICGLEWPTMSQVVYSKRVKAVRIGGIILVEKESAETYRKEQESKKSAKDREKVLHEKLASLTPEQLEALLKQIETPADQGIDASKADAEWKEPELGQELLES